MSFSEMSKEVIFSIMQGQDLFLQTKIPNRICKKFPMELRILQFELDLVINKFNERITKLEGRKIPKAEAKLNGEKEKKEGISEEQKSVILKKVEEEERKKGGGGLPNED